MKKYSVIGVMSGTSLDGLDLAHCIFEQIDGKWNVSIEKTETIVYQDEWRNRLSDAFHLKDADLKELDRSYGQFTGKQTLAFLQKIEEPVDFIASHGHTIHHKPKLGITKQIGAGEEICKITQKAVINDFRTQDVALNGQGAPLVPIGDLMLFPNHKYCINLGGFSNISIKKKNGVIAYDICPVNIVLNALALKLGKPYDQDGHIGASGKLNQPLLEKLNGLEYYTSPAPKSLGREWVEQKIFPLLEKASISLEDQMCTFYHHIAIQIAKQINDDENILITGGGGYNHFLIELIQKKTRGKIELPSPKMIEFKEAMIFGFLGCLFQENENNVLASVTGAERDHRAGQIHLP